MPTAEKAVKERDCTQMPVAKKERMWQRKKDQTTNAGGKRKWLPYAGKQSADTKRKKQNSWNHLETQTVAYLQA